MPREPSPTRPITRNSHCARCSRPDDEDMLVCFTCHTVFHRTCIGYEVQGNEMPGDGCDVCRANDRSRREEIERNDNDDQEEDRLTQLRNAPVPSTQASFVPSTHASFVSSTPSNIFSKGATPKVSEPSIVGRTLFEASMQQQLDVLQKQLNASLQLNQNLQQELMTSKMEKVAISTTSTAIPVSKVSYTWPPIWPPVLTTTNVTSSGYLPPATATVSQSAPGNATRTVNTGSVPSATANERQNAPGNPTPAVTLTPQQIGSRKSMDTKLPAFDGAAESWPIFISFYEHSTLACNFSDQENLLRLVNALKGPAREHVSSLLCLPQCVPRVIERLRARFGRPDVIIQTQLEKIRSLPEPNLRNLQTMVKFGDAVHNVVATMQAGNMEAYLTCPPIINELSQRLPSDLRVQWAAFSRSFPVLDLIIFDSWLDGLVSDICRVSTFPEEQKKRDPKRVHVTQEKPEEQKKRSRRRSHSSFRNTGPFVRNEQQKPTENSNYDERRSQTQILNANSPSFTPPRNGTSAVAQFNTPPNHQGGNPDNWRTGNTNNWRGGNPSTSRFVTPHNTHTYESSNVLFRILPVMLTNGEREIKTFAFIDSGSSISLIDDKIAKELQLEGPMENLCLEWTNGQTRTEEKSRRVSIKISNPQNCQQKYILKDVRTVVNLSLPRQSVNAGHLKDKFRHLRTLPLATYEFAQPMILLGADNASIGVPYKIVEGCENEPIALKCRIGWSVMGQISPQSSVSYSVNIHACSCNTLDDIGIVKKPDALNSADDIRALMLLKNTTKRMDDRYETGLLWKFDDVTLPDNKSMAIRRTNCLKSRLEKNPVMAANVHAQIAQMEADGYIRKMTPEEESRKSARTWYLPVFPVTNPSKPNKIRLVWDAAAIFRNVSLNKMLLAGPDQLPLLLQPLNRSRERKIVVNGDIRQMFHQIGVRKQDQDSQRFLWPSESGKLVTYVMQVMTFGSACSPAAAQYVKNLNAKSFEEDYPRAVASILHNHYVDDLMDSCDTEEEAIELAEQVKFIHSQGGFHIRGWKSNSKAVTDALEGSDSSVNLDLEAIAEKILGVWWHPVRDVIKFSLKYAKIDPNLLNLTRKPTKREVLSLLMSIFDPNGHLSHFVLQLRILLQESWRNRQHWDEQINEEQFIVWCHWIRQLPKIEKLEIRRCYLSTIDNYKDAIVELHMFVDAGNDAYAAVAYLRISKNGLVNVAQVGSKVKVAPLEPVSVPRLELQAALIGARYTQMIKKFLTITINEFHFWSDSTTVLGWIQSRRRYKPFVAYRVAEIRETTNVSDWHYISTRENVADEATKMRTKIDLDPEGRWFLGPKFLYEEKSQWPSEDPVISSPKDEAIQKETVAIARKVTPFIDYKRFSKYNRLVRATAYVFRFVETLKAKNGPNAALLTAPELHHAQMILIGLAQQEIYAREMHLMKEGKLSQTRKEFQQLCPYLDEKDIIRLDSRIVNAEVPFEQRYPILLPPHHAITRLIIRHEHEKCKHQFHETVWNNLLQRFFIPKGRRLVKEVVKFCQMCRVRNAKATTPRMAPLPVARLAISAPPFTHTGLDYFGPLHVTVGRRSEKRWGAIFTCLTVRAIHIEVAHTLSTESFLMCLKNFLNRRGNVKCIYSDRGTNFIGAEKILKEDLKLISERPMQEECAKDGIQWHFIPPHAPNMGGSWERLIQSVKKALYVALPDKNPPDEALKSALIEVEGLINARPLTYIPVNEATAPALTPNDFLGIKIQHPYSLTMDDTPATLKNSLQISQMFAAKFWKRFVSEYLPELTRRSKWFKDVPDLKLGDLVIIVDSNAKKGEWLRGIVETTNVSGDNKVRSVEVRTQKGVYCRPVSKCAKLDIDSSRTPPLGGSVKNPDAKLAN